ncbi:hypothetical protein MBLNU459_g2834t1 [Dothideomycetes sp. NU459]
MYAADIARLQQDHHHSQPQPQSRPQSRQQKVLKTGTWLPAEDARLFEAIAKYGTRWVAVATEVGSRNGDQCAKRWNENLNPVLDHSPWTAEELRRSLANSRAFCKQEERLMSLVRTYGHNWKFMAERFLPARAPLALKNRHSLLKRRLERQKNGQQQQPGPSRHASHARSSNESTSTSPSSGTNQMPFFGGDQALHNHLQDFSMSNTGGNLSLPAVQLNTNMESCSDSTIPRVSTIPIGTIPWDEQDLTWQHPHFSMDEMELSNIPWNTGANADGTRMEKLSTMSDKSAGSSRVDGVGNRGRSYSVAATDAGDSGIATATEVEYSVTCQRGRLKGLVNHLLEAAVSESAAWTTEDDQVVMTLRLKT